MRPSRLPPAMAIVIGVMTSYFFADGRSKRSGLAGAVLERGAFLGFLTAMFLVIGALGFYGLIREREWDVTTLIAGVPALLALWHYFGFVVEIRVGSEALSLRRLIKFRAIDWRQISEVRFYSLKTTGVTYVVVKGHSVFPLALFPLWIPWYQPARLAELQRLVEHVGRRVAVKHTA